MQLLHSENFNLIAIISKVTLNVMSCQPTAQLTRNNSNLFICSVAHHGQLNVLLVGQLSKEVRDLSLGLFSFVIESLGGTADQGLGLASQRMQCQWLLAWKLLRNGEDGWQKPHEACKRFAERGPVAAQLHAPDAACQERWRIPHSADLRRVVINYRTINSLTVATRI